MLDFYNPNNSSAGKPHLYKSWVSSTGDSSNDSNPRPTSKKPVTDKEGKFNVTMQALHGAKQEGLKTITMSNDKISAEIAIDLGGSIRQVTTKDGRGWQFLGGELTASQYLQPEDRNGLGGFLPNFGPLAANLAGGGHAGPASEVKARDNTGQDVVTLYPLHDELGRIPASEVKTYSAQHNGKDALVLECQFNEGHHQFGKWLTHLIRYTLEEGSNHLDVTHSIRNDSKTPQNVMAMYHLNQKTDPGDYVMAPIEKIKARDDDSKPEKWSDGTYRVAMYRSELDDDHAEEVSYANLKPDADGNYRTAVIKGDDSSAVSFTYDESLPDTTLWVSDKYDGVAIEPGSHHSIPRAKLQEADGSEFAIRPLEKLDPGADPKLMRFRVGIHDNPSSVQALKEEISQAQGQTSPEVIPGKVLG